MSCCAPGGEACATDQILYNVTERGAEFELMPKRTQRHMPVMAYSPVGQGRLPRSPALAAIGERYDATPFQVALAWVLRHPYIIAIPKAANEAHVKDNLRAAELTLDAEDLAAIDADSPRQSGGPAWRCSNDQLLPSAAVNCCAISR
jgi:diketogulonate reductase-like aldo/keto reductase